MEEEHINFEIHKEVDLDFRIHKEVDFSLRIHKEVVLGIHKKVDLNFEIPKEDQTDFMWIYLKGKIQAPIRKC